MSLTGFNPKELFDEAIYYVFIHAKRCIHAILLIYFKIVYDIHRHQKVFTVKAERVIKFSPSFQKHSAAGRSFWCPPTTQAIKLDRCEIIGFADFVSSFVLNILIEFFIRLNF